MNRSYKSIYNERTGTFVAVAENVKAKGKRSSSRVSKTGVLAAVVAAGALFAGSAGAQVVINEPDGTIAGVENLTFSAAGTITGLSSLTVSGSLNANQITIGSDATLAADSVEAVRGSQLFTTNQNVTTAQNAANAAQATANDAQSAVDAANTDINALDGRVTTNEGAIATNTASITQNTTDIAAVKTTAEAGWNISAGGGASAKVAPGATVNFSGGNNIAVTRNGTDLTISLSDDIEVNSITAGSAALGEDGLTIGTDGPSITTAGIDAGGIAIKNLASGDIAADSKEAVTGGQIYEFFMEDAGGAGGIKYFRANSVEAASSAVGEESVAIGPKAVSEGDSSLAAGDGAQTTEEGEGAIALGQNAVAGGEDAGSGGAGAIAIGRVSTASGTSSVALGDGTTAAGANATALGGSADASGGNSIAIGNAAASGGNSFAAGLGAVAATNNSIALGAGAGEDTGTEVNDPEQRHSFVAIGHDAGQNMDGNQAIAIGVQAGSNTVGSNQIAIGAEAGKSLTGERNVSLGYQANLGGGKADHAVAIGGLTQAMTDGVAVGYGAKAMTDAVALGAGAVAEDGSIALGQNSYATKVSGTGRFTGDAYDGPSVSVGNASTGLRRRITNVEAGSHDYDAVNVEQLQALKDSLGSFTPTSGGNANYNVGGTLSVAAATADGEAVNLAQMNARILKEKPKFYSINPNGDTANFDGDGALGPDSANSMAIGHAARIDASERATAVGYNVLVKGSDGTALGSGSVVDDAAGVAIGHEAYSRGTNSLAMGTDAQTEEKGVGQSVDNAIAIGTSSRASADSASAFGHHATAVGVQSSALGYSANARALDSMAFGTDSYASGVSSQASGTLANATGDNAQASGTSANASGYNAIATGTRAFGYAMDGIAMGTDAVSGFSDPFNQDPERNTGGIAIGNSALADNYHALAMGWDAHAEARSATAIGDAARADAEDALAVGSSAGATAQNASAFGQSAQATAQDALAVGSGASASRQSASAIGHDAEASAVNASAFGQGARALHEGSVALGSGSETAEATGTSSIVVDKNTYNFAGTDPVATVSVGKKGQERTITNVAAGRIDANSTDAINGSQLYSTNQAVDALGNDLDTVGNSVAASLGGTSAYNPETHTVTAGLSVQGNNYTNVQDALTYVGQGWDVSANGQAGANVAPGGSVDFSSTDGNIDISRDTTNLAFNLSDDLAIGNSITVNGGTRIDGDSIRTTNLTVEGETRLGDNFVVNNDNSVVYNGAEIATQTDGLSFAGNTGGTIAKTLGDDGPLVVSGGLDGGAATTGANLRVDSDGNQLNLVMAQNLTDLTSITITDGPVINNSGINMGDTQITNLKAGTEGHHAVNLDQLKDVEAIASAGWDVSAGGGEAANVAPGGGVNFSNTDDNIEVSRTNNTTDLVFNLADDITVDSVTAGDSVLDTDGLTVGDDDGNKVVVAADNVTLTDDDGNSTITTAAGTTVTDGTATTTVGAGVVTVAGGANTITIDGATGTIAGLSNTTLDAPDFATAGRAATEEQLQLVNATANAGWDVATSGNATASNVAPGSRVDFVGDSNIRVNHETTAEGVEVAVTLNEQVDLGEDGSVTTGNTVMDNDGVKVADADTGDTTTLTADGVTITDVAGNSNTSTATGVEVADTAGNTTTVGAGVIDIAGATHTITIDGATGTIAGLSNTTLDAPDFATAGRAATEEQLQLVNATANAGWNVATSGNPTVNNVAPNAQVDFVGDSNVTVSHEATADGDVEVAVTLNKDIDLGEDGSVTTGNTVMNNDGVEVADADTGDTMTLTADGVTITDIAGNSNTSTATEVVLADAYGNTTTVGAGMIGVGDTDGFPTIEIGGGDVTIRGLTGAPGPIKVGETLMMGLNFAGNNYDAANPGTLVNKKFGETLEILGVDWIETRVEDGKIYISLTDDFPVVDKPGSGGGGGGGSDELGNIVAGGTIEGGNNINVSTDPDDPNTIIVETTPDVEHDSVKVGDVVIDKDGINAGDTQITGVADGTQDDHAVNLGQLNDVEQKLTEEGLNFSDSNGDVVHRDLGDTLQITGADANITTKVDAAGGILEIALSPDLNVDSITINNGGPVINENGIDMSGKRITNVAAGIDGTDAVNVNQLKEVEGKMQNQINDLRGDMRRQDRKLRAGVAAAMATASLPQAYLPGKSMMAVAGGTWNGESGMAIGYSGISDNGKWVVKLSGNASSRGDYGGAVGVGYQW